MAREASLALKMTGSAPTGGKQMMEQLTSAAKRGPSGHAATVKPDKVPSVSRSVNRIGAAPRQDGRTYSGVSRKAQNTPAKTAVTGNVRTAKPTDTAAVRKTPTKASR